MIFTLKDLIAVYKYNKISEKTLLLTLEINEHENKKFPDYSEFYIDGKLKKEEVKKLYD